jgi:hypothetical protein
MGTDIEKNNSKKPYDIVLLMEDAKTLEISFILIQFMLSLL